MDEGRRSGSALLTMPIAFVLLTWGVFVPAARGASTQATEFSEGPTTTVDVPNPSTTYVTVPPTSVWVVPATVTTVATFPFRGQPEDAFPTTSTPRAPERGFDMADDVSSEPEPGPAERDTLPDDGLDPALPAGNESLPAPSTTTLTPSTTTLTPSTTTVTQSAVERSSVASPPRARPVPAATPEAAIDMTANNRGPSLFWPGVLALGALLLLGGPRLARRLRHPSRLDVRHDIA